MASPRPPRTFNLYEVIGVVIPGFTLLLGLLALFPNPPSPPPLWQYVPYAIAAFSLGYFVQYLAGTAVGTPGTFEETMDEVRNLADDGDDDSQNLDAVNATGEEEGETEAASEEEGETVAASEEGETEAATEPSDDRQWVDLLHHMIYSYIGPLLYSRWNPTDESTNETMYANLVWKDLRDTYDLEQGYDNYEELRKMIQSDVDDVVSPSRAYRFQAIRNFHRGMWMALWIILFLALFHWAVPFGSSISFWLVTFPSSVLSSPRLGGWSILLIAASLPMFWLLYWNFQRRFVTYLVLDYHVQWRTQDSDGSRSR